MRFIHLQCLKKTVTCIWVEQNSSYKEKHCTCKKTKTKTPKKQLYKCIRNFIIGYIIWIHNLFRCLYRFSVRILKSLQIRKYYCMILSRIKTNGNNLKILKVQQKCIINNNWACYHFSELLQNNFHQTCRNYMYVQFNLYFFYLTFGKSLSLINKIFMQMDGHKLHTI